MPDPIQGVKAAGPPEVASADHSAKPPGGSQAGPASGAGAGAVDSADVGRAQALLETIATTANQVPTVDQARVAELQQAIQSGTYQVNPQQIAQKIAQIEGLLAPGGPAK